MSCEITASQNGQPCCRETLERIRQHVATVEAIRGPLRACSVDIQTQSNRHHANVFVSLGLLPETGPSVFKRIGYAKQDDVPGALEAAFAFVSARSAGVLLSAGLQAEPGHIIQLSPQGHGGTIEMDNGCRVEFRVATPLGPSASGVAHVGDRVWLKAAARADLPGELICARRGGSLPLHISTGTPASNRSDAA